MKTKYSFFLIAVMVCLQGYSQPWLNNAIGKDNRVPFPWQALSIKETNTGYSVLCWGRSYDFQGQSLLSQVTAIGSPLLNKPISILYGKSNAWEPVSKKVIKQMPNEIELEFVSSQTIGVQNVKLKTNIAVHYDGLVYYRMQLSAKSALTESISLKITLTTEHEKLIHRWNYASAKNKQWWVSGDFPLADQMPYIPYFWIGNSSKGLFWFAESPYNWLNYKSSDAVVFGPKGGVGDNCSAVINLVKSKQNTTNEWSFEFGLQATPVKPRSDEKRNWVLSGASTSNVNIIWPEANKPYALKHYGYPEPVNITAFNQHVNELKKNGEKALVYNCLSFLSNASTEGRMFEGQWDIAATPDKAGDVRAFNGSFARINFTAKTYQDFIIWKSNQLLKTTQLDGYYLDNVMIENLNFNKLVKAFPGTKEKLPYYPFLQARSLYERFYKMVKKFGEDKIIVTHSSSRVVPPILAFSDVFVDGEQFRENGARVNNDYLKVTNLKAFQSEFSGKPFGLTGIFLPAFDQKNYSIAEPTRNLAAILIQHDIKAWPIWSAAIVWDEINKAYNQFPAFSQSLFKSYYSEDALVKTGSSNFLVSSYKNKFNEYICLVSNLSEREITQKLSFSGLDLSKYNLKQATSRGRYSAVTKNSLIVTVPAKDYLIFYLKKG